MTDRNGVTLKLPDPLAKKPHLGVTWSTNSLEEMVPRELSSSELEKFPSLDWFDVAPQVEPAMRSSLERILAAQNGNAVSQEEAHALAHAEGDDLLGLLAAANLPARRTLRQSRNLRGESQHQTSPTFVSSMQVLRLQPRSARV